jgi:hypothetical protein
LPYCRVNKEYQNEGQEIVFGKIVLTATLASIGTAGVPGAGMIMLTMVLTAVGLPSEGIAQFSRILQDRADAMNGRCTVPLFLLKRSSPKKKHSLQVYPTSCVLHLSH